jgi:hypothetical protein
MNREELTIEELDAELRAMREVPSEEFAAKLDARAAEGFARRPAEGPIAGLPGRLAERLRDSGARRHLLPALAGATTVIVVATAVVVSVGGDGDSPAPTQSSNFDAGGAAEAGGTAAGGAAKAGGPVGEAELLAPTGSRVADSGEPLPSQMTVPPPVPGPGPGTAPGARNRQVERSAELTLGTDPEQVQDLAAKAIDVVGRYRGIVLSSSTRDGAEGAAGANFQLLVPSGRLSPALADLSRLAEVRSRNENTLDITAPFVSARERLRDARAEAEGLLRELAAADTVAERNSVKGQLEIVRGRIAAFRAQVQRLERRADYSRVSLQIVSGEASVFPGPSDEEWTIGDALHDAGRVLAVAAGIALVAAAVMLPLGLLAGAAWAGRRIYLRRAREQTLAAR